MDRHQNDPAGGRDRTPEPTLLIPQASVPKRKRRRVPKTAPAPTTCFLAEISSADIPIPSVELPDEIENFKFTRDVEMHDGAPTPTATQPDHLAPSKDSLKFVTPPPRQRSPSPSFDPKDYSPDRATNRSTDSDHSFNSNNGASSGSYTSFESDPSFGGAKQPNMSYFNNHPGFEKPNRKPNTSEISNHAFWSKEMNKHLWSTFEKFTCDPRVTPYPMSSPPEGVYRIVSQKARTTWKGGPAHENGTSYEYTPWPHTMLATRDKLKEMVKRNCAPPGAARYCQSRSPSPTGLFGLHRRVQKNRSETGERASDSQYSTRGIAVALATSTSEAMQPDGPLAHLSRDPGKDAFGGMVHIKSGRQFVMDATREQRGASPPFIADTYSSGYSRKEPELPKPFGPRTFGGPGTVTGFLAARNVQEALAREKEQEEAEARARANGEPPRTPRLRSPVHFPEHSNNGENFRRLREKTREERARARARRNAMGDSCMKYARGETPVLPPGWGSYPIQAAPMSAAPMPTAPIARALASGASSQPSTIASDSLVEPARLDSPFTATNHPFPRERINKKPVQPTRQRAAVFDSTYFRRFNEEQARAASVDPCSDVEMADGSDTDSEGSQE